MNVAMSLLADVNAHCRLVTDLQLTESRYLEGLVFFFQREKTRHPLGIQGIFSGGEVVLGHLKQDVVETKPGLGTVGYGHSFELDVLDFVFHCETSLGSALDGPGAIKRHFFTAGVKFPGAP